jgi:hypothetical protein
MSTISEYLNELITQRDKLADNLNTKGVAAEKTETFNTLVPKVLDIKSGGSVVTGGALIGFHLSTKEGTLLSTLLPTGSEKFFLSDTILKPGLSKADFSDCSDNISAIEYVSQLILRVALTSVESGTSLAFKASGSAYEYENGESTSYSDTFKLPLSGLYGNTEGCTYLRTDSYTDSGTDSFTPEFQFPKIQRLITTLGDDRGNVGTYSINADSYIDFEAGGKDFCFNQQDAGSVSTGYGIFDTDDFGKVLKIFWKGMSHYNLKEEDQYYELYFFEDGDIMFRLDHIGTNTSGVDTFLSTKFTQPDNGGVISFYRQDYYGTEYKIEYEAYSLAKRSKVASDKKPSTTLTSLIGSTEGIAALQKDTKNDDGTVSLKLSGEATWRRNGADVTTIVWSGNSWIGIGGSNEDIKLCRRDSALYTARAGIFELSDLGLTCIKAYWDGSSHYSSSVDRTWGLYLFSNGDAMIHLTRLGSYKDGTYTFFGTTYTVAEGESVSFYRTDAAGTAWNVSSGIYDISKHVVDPS